MFGLSFWEIAVILVAALLLFGPSKLPELARNLGKGLREFRRATDEFRTTMEEEAHRPEASKRVDRQAKGELPSKASIPEVVAVAEAVPIEGDISSPKPSGEASPNAGPAEPATEPRD